MRKSALRDALMNMHWARPLRHRLVPRSLRARILGLWKLRKRLELSPASVQRLKAVFDEDLKVLGQWLDLSLTCDSFAVATASTVPAWRGLESRRGHVGRG